MSEPWTRFTLGDVISLEYGAALPASVRSGREFPVFGSSGEVGRHATSLVHGPGIVVGRKGTVGQVSWSDEAFWPIDTTYFVVPKNAEMRWLFWTLCRQPLHRLDSSTGVPGLNRNDAYELPVDVPSPPEQRQIAAILDTVDGAIRKTEQIIAKLKQVKQGMLRDLLTRGIDDNGKLRDPERHPEQFADSPLGRLPKGWQVASLGDALLRIDAGKSPNCPDRPAQGDEWGVLKVSAVRPDGFQERENKAITNPAHVEPDFEIRDGDLLITRANTYELVGLTCLVGASVGSTETTGRLHTGVAPCDAGSGECGVQERSNGVC